MNTSYLIQRLFLTLIVLLGVTFVVFLIIHLVPGDPARVILGVQANEQNVAALRERLGLNRPFLVQYADWLWNAAHGDFGKSLITGQPVGPQLMQRLPATLQLAIAGLLIGMLIGFPAGIIFDDRNIHFLHFVDQIYGGVLFNNGHVLVHPPFEMLDNMEAQVTQADENVVVF